MEKSTARELAFVLCLSLAVNPEPPAQAMESFFEPAYFETLAEEDPVFAQAPTRGRRKYIKRLVCLSQERREELDAVIGRYAQGWRVERISKPALTALRLALCEILYMPDVPNGAAINEAVELVKRYDSPETASYVNGVLGSFMRSEAEAGAAAAEKPLKAPESGEPTGSTESVGEEAEK